MTVFHTPLSEMFSHQASTLTLKKIKHCKMTDLITDCLCLLNCIQIFNLYQETFRVRKLKQKFRVEIEAF